MAIRKISDLTCPFCGCREFTEGVQEYQASVQHTKKMFSRAQPLYHVFCTECGSVVRSFVYNPKKFSKYPEEDNKI